jgi:SAM-dependent methyltransferase
VIRRRKGAVQARRDWIAGRTAPLARAIDSQTGMALLTPRAGRLISLLELGPGKRYVDIGCGTSAFAHLLARRAGMDEPPVCLDIAPGPGPVDALAWPEHLPLADASVDAFTSLYLMRRLDDDVAHGFGGELARVLAPGGRGIILEIAPVRSERLNRLHTRLVSGGCGPVVDLRGWGRMAALFTEVGFDHIQRIDLGPFLLPPIPRCGVLLRRAPGGCVR